MHLNDEALRAYRDRDAGAAMPQSLQEIAAHLQVCPVCRDRLSAVESQSNRVAARLTALDPDASSAAEPATVALRAYYARHPIPAREENLSMFATLFPKRLRPLWAGAAILMVLVLSFSLQPVRAWAGEVLKLFRVQQMTVLPVDMTQLTTLQGNQALGSEISKFVSDSVTVTEDPGDPQAVASADEASQAAGFSVRLPQDASGTPQIVVEGAGSFEYTADRAKIVGILSELGYADADLPASVDGALIKVRVPAAVTAGYGDCPNLLVEETASALESGTTSRMSNCVLVSQLPSPTVDAPKDLDIGELAEIGLQLSGMTADQAREFSQTVDWTTTLVVPIPRNGSTYTRVAVDGVNGYLIERQAKESPQYALIWVKDGIIYAIGGEGADSSAALAMADSMK